MIILNLDKTKVMSNIDVAPIPLLDGDSMLDIVDMYVYLETRAPIRWI